MWTLISSACLISPIDPPIEEPVLNHPPVIVAETVQPVTLTINAGVFVAHCSGGQLDLEFEVGQVIEYDLDQSLFISWFVDYTDDTFKINSRPFYEPAPIDALGDDPVRDVNQRVRVPASWLPATERVGLHLVEVIVSDAEPLTTGRYPYRTLPEGAASDRQDWTVEITEADCP